MARALALVGGTLLDGRGSPPLPNAALVVDNRRISRVGRVDEGVVPDGVPVVDVSGMSVMPGLIDGHVHLLAYAGVEQRDIHLWNVTTFIEEQTLHAAANALTALRCGVTTVRDMAGSRPEVAVKHAIADGVLDGARVVASGFVGMTAGHGDLFCPAAIERRLWQTADGPHECRKLVRQYARDGVDFIKICTSGGVLSVGDKAEWRNFTMEETLAIVDEAHALGMRVAAHAHTRAGIRQALEAGVDTLEHGSDLDDELIEMLVRHQTWLCPTLAISEYILSSGAARGVPPASLDKAARMRERQVTSLRAAWHAGVPIFMGTDSCNTFAFGSHAWELELMCRYLGMSAMDAIVAATSSAAQALDVAGETGALEPGLAADLLIVAGDPVQDIRVLQEPDRILGVYRDGRLVVDRGLMQRRLAQVG